VTVTVILIPVVLLMVMVLLQAALVFHARSIVTAAATDAARAAQADGGTATDGRVVADQLLDGSGHLVIDPNVTVDRRGERVVVDITAHVTSLVPGWTPTVTAHADGPVETFRASPR
jgi:Flp pilus assembly protein TadG